jgi:hypothetical protein
MAPYVSYDDLELSALDRPAEADAAPIEERCAGDSGSFAVAGRQVRCGAA